jgi:hypothetical protein
MSDIVERLQNMFFRFGGESPEDAANRRIQTAKDAADEIEKLRAERDMLKRDNEIMVGMINDMGTIFIKARAALGEKQ